MNPVDAGISTAAAGSCGATADRGIRESLYEWARHSTIAQGAVLPAFEDLEGGTMPILLEARTKEWKAQWYREGHEQGVAQGAAQGKAELLRGLAAHKFGGPEGERVSALIEPIRDPDQLARVGGWLIECKSASDLLARLERLPRDGKTLRMIVIVAALPSGRGCPYCASR